MAKAPDFTLKDQNGQDVRLADVLKQSPALIAFYPGDFTPVCTRQLCGYSENMETFRSFGVEVIGISSDSVGSHAKFAGKHGFPFALLSDPDKKVAKAYGCTSLFMLGKVSRAVFVVGKDGEILYKRVEATVVTHRSAADLREVLDGLKAAGKIPLVGHKSNC